MHLMTYDFEIKYRPGKLNAAADALSRVEIPEERVVNAIFTDKAEDSDGWNEELIPYTDVIWTKEEISKAQFQDKETNRIIQIIKHETTGKYYLDREDKILYRMREIDERHDKIVAPEAMRRRILEIYHDTPMAAHRGHKKTLEFIRSKFFWKGMTVDVKKYVDNCHSCAQRNQIPIPKAPLMEISVPAAPFDKISLDIVGPLNQSPSGCRYILTCIDYLTRYAEAIPLENIQAATIARMFAEKIIARHGVPKVLITDCGSQFLSSMFKEVCQILRIKKLQTLPYCPASNGVIERLHRSLKGMISHFVTEIDNAWDSFLPFVLMSYHNSVHRSLNETPFFLMHGRDMNAPTDIYSKTSRVRYDVEENYATELFYRLQKAHKLAKEHLESAAIKQTTASRKRGKERELKVGDRVYVKIPTLHARTNLAEKLKPKYDGPYRIMQRFSPVTFEVQHIENKKTQKVHINRLKKFKGIIPREDNDNALTSDSSSSAEREEEQNKNQEYITGPREPGIEILEATGGPELEPGELRPEPRDQEQPIDENTSEPEEPEQVEPEPEPKTTDRAVEPVAQQELEPGRRHLRSHGPAPEYPRIYQGRI